MAKISQYAVDGTPSLSDKLIGTDVTDSSITKNYTLSSILTLFGTGSSGFVPYTGANADVNLGTNSISSQNVTIAGTLSANGGVGTSGQVLTSQGIGLPSIWQTPASGSVTSSLIANRFSTSTQSPSGLDTPMVVSFGGFFTSPELTISPIGLVQFIQAGTYVVRFFINAGVTSSAPTDNVYFQIRSLINGSQTYRTKCLFLNPTNGRSTPYQETFVYTASATDTLGFEVLRSSSGGGLDFGSLIPFTGTGGFSNIPSAEIQIWKIG